MGQEGPANGRIQLVAQGEAHAATTIDASPTPYSLRRFSQGRGAILRGGVQLAGVTGGSLTFSNNLERVRVIREDGKIEAADPTFASAQGTDFTRWWLQPLAVNSEETRVSPDADVFPSTFGDADGEADPDHARDAFGCRRLH
jgi:hypothetical protein